MAIYGLAAGIAASTPLTASYSIDGVTQVKSVAKDTFDSVPMTELFSAAGLAPGRHKLLVNITSITSPQAYGIDFIAYNSSVNSITTLPGYKPVMNAGPSGFESASGLSVGAKVGAVFGGLATVALLAAGFFVWRAYKGKSKRVPQSSSSSYDDIEATSACFLPSLCARALTRCSVEHAA